MVTVLFSQALGCAVSGVPCVTIAHCDVLCFLILRFALLRSEKTTPSSVECC